MKKVISVLLSVVLVFSVMGICVSADSGLSYNGVAKITVGSKCELNPEDFNVTVSIDNQKIASFDGESEEFTCTINSITTTDGVDYYTDPEAFFQNYTKEDFDGSTVNVDFTVDFVSDKVFGTLEYNVVVTGFSAPPESEGGGIIDLIGGLVGGSSGGTPDIELKVPTDLTATGTIDSFPAIAPANDAVTVVEIAKKNSYTDAERFDPTGVKLNVVLANGTSGTVTYSDESAHAFAFYPSANENLTVYDTEVAMTFFGRLFGYTPITVEHQFSCDADGNEAFVNITTNKYTETNPGYHAVVCEGCGEAHNAQPHTPKNEDWVYNNDATFVKNGTMSNVCKDCGVTLVADAFGTAGFNTTFEDMHFIKVIFEYINVLLRFIGAATE